jgi:periplasmic divalent cation tolerance protein
MRERVTDKRIVFSTAGSKQEAQEIARELVERKVAACVNVMGPVSSTYWWQGKVEISEEWLLIIKTTGEQFASVSRWIKELHSYETPECIAVEVSEGSAEYLRWIEESLSEQGEQGTGDGEQ